MNHLHSKLTKKYQWYAQWHNHPQHIVFHFIILFVVGYFFANAIVDNISAVYADNALATEVNVTVNNISLIKSLNKQFLEIAKQYKQTDSLDEKQYLETQLLKLVSDRKIVMLNEVKKNPHNFKLFAIPPKLRNELPESVTNAIEEEIDIQGSLQVVHFTRAPNSLSTFDDEYNVTDQTSGKKYHLNFEKEKDQPELLTGSRVKVHGIVLENQIAPEPAEAGTTGSTGDSGVTTISAATVAAPTINKTLVILLNFSDNQSQPYTKEQATDRIFTGQRSTNAYYMENSYGKEGFAGDVVGWYTASFTSAQGGCDYYSLWNAADSAATKAGINISSYAKRMVLAPYSGCSFGGVGELGGTHSAVLFFDWGGIEHELGHNLGVHHASSWNCGSKQIDAYSYCTQDEYGDIYDDMGNPWYGGFQWNAGHKVYKGWVPSSQILTVASPGRYTIAPLEANTTNPQVLKVLFDQNQYSSNYYYVGYRQPVGYDSGLPGGITGGAEVVLFTYKTALLDMNPDGGNFSNAALADGGTFADTIYSKGVHITQVSHDADGVTLDISYVAPPCNSATPTMSVSPLSQSGAAGSTVKYTVYVNNTDGANCTASTFVVNVSGQSGFVSSQSSITINPGTMGSIVISVTSPIGTPDDTYPITLNVNDTSNALHTASASVNDIVFTPVTNCVRANPTLTVAPTANTGVATQKLTYKVTVKNNDNSYCGASSFSVKSNVPDGWISSVSTVKPNPGSSSSANISVTSVASAVPRGYTLNMTANDVVIPTHTNSIAATYTVYVVPPPVVSITLPADGSILANTVTISANTTYSFGIKEIDLLVDGVKIKACGGSPCSATNWSTVNLLPGLHTITAKAIGKTSPSMPVASTNTTSITVTK